MTNGVKMTRQALLFELPAEEMARKERMKAILNDRKLARYLMHADEDERDAINFLWEDNEGEFTLAEAIQMCIDNPSDENCW